MLQPKKTKWRKSHKVLPRRKYTKRGDQIAFGSFGIKAITPGRINSRQIEAARIAITRYLKREGQVWIRIFPDRPVTKKPAEVRMGKGKGSLEYWATPVEPGRILFEVDGVPLDVAKEGLRLAAQKLPVVVKFVVRRDYQA
jgi:large subunit ribosomal protein L16